MALNKAFGLFSVEWDNSKQLIALEAGIALMAFLILGNLNAIFLNTGETELAGTTIFLQGLILFGAILFGLEKIGERVKSVDIFETVGYGRNLNNFVVASVTGFGIALLLNIGNLGVITPALQSALDVGTQNLLFLVFFAATVEELFFRGTLLPTLFKLFQTFKLPFASELALFGQAIVFGLFHLGIVLAVNPNASLFSPQIVASIVFGLIAGAGNGFFESTGFSYSAHLTNNFLVASSAGLI